MEGRGATSSQKRGLEGAGKRRGGGGQGRGRGKGRGQEQGGVRKEQPQQRDSSKSRRVQQGGRGRDAQHKSSAPQKVTTFVPVATLTEKVASCVVVPTNNNSSEKTSACSGSCVEQPERIGKLLLAEYKPEEVANFTIFHASPPLGPMHIASLSAFLPHVAIPGYPPLYSPPSIMPIELCEESHYCQEPIPSIVPLLLAGTHGLLNKDRTLNQTEEEREKTEEREKEKEENKRESPLSAFDFVLERSSFNKIVNRSQPWTIGLQRVGRTIFFRRYPDRKSQNKRDIGNLFEAACTTTTYNSKQPQRPQHKISTTQFVRVVTARVGRYSVLMSGETDAVDEEGHPIELKTGNKEWPPKVARAVWLQSHLLGVEKVIFGHKTPLQQPQQTQQPRRKPQTERVRIDKVKELEVKSLTGERYKEECFEWLAKVLDFFKENVKEEDKVYKFVREKKKAGTNNSTEGADRVLTLFACDDPAQQFVTQDLLESVVSWCNAQQQQQT